MTDQLTFVYYQGGAYGTFFEWCLNYFTDSDFPEDLPFLDSTGSAHRFNNGNFIWNVAEFEQLKQSGLPKFFRGHPGAFTDVHDLINTPKSYGRVLSIDLQELTSVTANGIFLHYSTDKSWLWGINNQIEKAALTTTLPMEIALKLIKEHNLPKDQYPLVLEHGVDYIKASLVHSGISELSLAWNKSSIDNLDLWELRELLSLYFIGEKIDHCNGQIFNAVKTEFPNILVIDIFDLKNNFKEIIKEIIKPIGPLVREDKIDEVYSQWIARQIHCNKDTLIQNIVHSLVNDIEFNWPKLTLIDEAFLQHYLRVQGYEIKCWNLNMFPTNTNDFLPLLELNQ